MAQLLINGGLPLTGRVRARGAKNAALPILAATLLSEGPVTLHRIPHLQDVTVMLEILRSLGARVETAVAPDGLVVKVQAKKLHWRVPRQLTKVMRSSILVLGPLLARLGRVQISYPGGCIIGSRPIDLHLQALQRFGAGIEEVGGYVTAETTGLRAARVKLAVPSVGATENLMMAAVLAPGESTISNAAREPEIEDLQKFLNSLGAKVHGAGSDTITVQGGGQLSGGNHAVIPDRIEAATLLMAGVITKGDVQVDGVIPQHLAAVLDKMRAAGIFVAQGHDWVRSRWVGRPKGINVTTLPYPGFPTDAQNQILTLLATAQGTSVITETIYEQRLKIVSELQRMGAKVNTSGRVAVVQGVPQLQGAQVVATDDLRGVASLVLAGLGAQGTTLVDGAQFLDRGYEDFAAKLRNLGADIRRYYSSSHNGPSPDAVKSLLVTRPLRE